MTKITRAPLTTTLAAIRKAKPCKPGWEKLLQHVGDMPTDAPLLLTTILDSNGVGDTLWVAYCAVGETARNVLAAFIGECVLRACDHAERALPIFEASRPGDAQPRKAIKTARACVAGTISARHARAAASAAYAAAYAADASASAAANAAANAAYAADNAAYASTASEAERKWQVKRLRQYLDGKVAP